MNFSNSYLGYNITTRLNMLFIPTLPVKAEFTAMI